MNPIAIFDNPTRNCVYVVTDDANRSGKPVIAIIDKNKSTNFTDAHIITSAYGMDDFIGYAKDHIPKNARIEIFNKEKLAKRLLGVDVQFVMPGTSLNEFTNVILHEDR